MKGSLQRHATTVILVALALAAAIAVFVLDRGAVSTGEAELRKKNLFEAWRRDEITELTVTTSGGPGATPGAERTARLTRGELDDAGQRPWSVAIDGQEHAADEQAVDRLLGTLEFATAERRVSADASDRAALGLDAPRLAVALVMGSRRERLVVGGGAPTPPGAVYAEVAGRGVFVITKQLAAALDTAPERFRSRSFVPYAPSELAGLSLDGEGGARRFVRARWHGGGGRGAGFRFDDSAPGTRGVRVSAPALDAVLAAVGRMQAEAFLSDEQAERAAAPKVTLTLTPVDPAAKRVVVALGGACPDKPDHVVAVRREPTRSAVCVPASVLDALTAEASRFVDLGLIGAPLDEIAEVELTAGGRSLELARAEAEWHLRAPEDRRVPTEIGRALVQAVLDVDATRVSPAGGDADGTDDLRALGLDPPRATLRVVSTPTGSPSRSAGPPSRGAAPPDAEPSERVEALEIGAEQGGVVHVRRVEDGAIAEIPAASAEALMPSEIALRPFQVFEFQASRVRSLRVERAGRVQRLRRGDDGGWQLVEPTGVGLEADSALAEALAGALGSLKAERWAASGADGGFGLGAPRLTIEAEIDAQEPGAAAPGAAATAGAPGPRTARLELGASAGAGAFARSGDSPAVFIAPAALETAAGRLLLSRTVFLVPLEDVTRITLAPAGGRAVVIDASARGWTIVGARDEDGATSAARAAAVRDALADLTVEGAVALGAPDKQHGLTPPRLELTVELAHPGASPTARGPVRIAIGAGDVFQSVGVYYARREGVAATYAIAQSRVRPLLEAVGAR